jgi:hypothetical protein
MMSDYTFPSHHDHFRNLQISRYNAIDLSEDVSEDFGWKLVHGEVFRTPQKPMILSVLVGNGAQLCAMVVVTLGALDGCCVFDILTQSSSVRIARVPLTFQPRIIGNSHDGLLDVLREVSFCTCY